MHFKYISCRLLPTALQKIKYDNDNSSSCNNNKDIKKKKMFYFTEHSNIKY